MFVVAMRVCNVLALGRCVVWAARHLALIVALLGVRASRLVLELLGGALVVVRLRGLLGLGGFLGAGARMDGWMDERES